MDLDNIRIDIHFTVLWLISSWKYPTTSLFMSKLEYSVASEHPLSVSVPLKGETTKGKDEARERLKDGIVGRMLFLFKAIDLHNFPLKRLERIIYNLNLVGNARRFYVHVRIN